VTTERDESLRRLARAQATLDRLTKYVSEDHKMVRCPTPDTSGLVAYEFDMGRLIATSVSRLSLAACETLDAIAALLDELEALVAKEES